MSLLLKWEIDTLAASARYYKFRERQLQDAARATRLQVYEDQRAQLNIWRTAVHRAELRAAHLAYGLLRGRQYWDMEARCHTAPDFERVLDFVADLGGPFADMPYSRAWVDAARDYLEAYPPTSHNRPAYQPQSLSEVLGRATFVSFTFGPLREFEAA